MLPVRELRILVSGTRKLVSRATPAIARLRSFRRTQNKGEAESALAKDAVEVLGKAHFNSTAFNSSESRTFRSRTRHLSHVAGKKHVPIAPQGRRLQRSRIFAHIRSKKSNSFFLPPSISLLSSPQLLCLPSEQSKR